MSNGKSFWSSGSVIGIASVLLTAFSMPAIGQQVPAVHVGSVQVTGVPEDWSQRHVVFSNPGTEQEAISAGRHGQWQKVVNSPRYVMQQLRNGLPVQGPAAIDSDYRKRWIAEAYGNGRAEQNRHSDRGRGPRFREPRRINHWEQQITPPSDVHRDWSMPLGGPGLAAANYPAKYSFSNTNASCTDYIVYPTGAAGGAAKATIVAFTNIYVGSTGNACESTNPTVYWAFNTPPGGITADSATANLSPVLSNDGTQVAFVETYSSTGYLVILKMSSRPSSAYNSPVVPTYKAPASYLGCTAPCYTTISLGANNTSSAPFYDYSGNDTLYVGDNAGKVHEVTGVFSGTPTMDTLSGWPVTASTTGSPALTSPIYDSGGSNRIFVTDIAGYLHSFTLAAPGTVTTSGQLEYNGTSFDPPIVDSTTELVYTFIGYSGDTGHTRPSYINRFPAAALGLAGTGAGGSDFGTGVYYPNAGTATTSIMHDGAFDYQYYIGNGTTGNIYSCVNGTVYQIPLATISGSTVNTFSTPVSSASTSTAAACSPVTEFQGVKASTTLSAATTGTTTTTTLSAAINHATNPSTTYLRRTATSTQTYTCVNSITNILTGDYIGIDSEIMYVTGTGGTGCSSGTKVSVDRGVAGTTGAAHSSGTTVTVTIYSTYILVPTGASAAAGNYIQVDSEDMLVSATYADAGIPGLTLLVSRGQLGTTAATHASGATVSVLSQITVASSTGVSAGDYIQIDSEILSVSSVLSSTSLLVMPGQLGTTAAAHANGAQIQDLRDGIFTSVLANGNTAGCTGACVYAYNVISGAATGSPTAALQETGATSGIVIDNLSTTQIGAQQIYFSTLTGDTAVQASQAALN